MALTFKSLGRAIGKTVKTLAKPAAIVGLGMINPALGAIAGKAMGAATVAKTAAGTIGAILGKKAGTSPATTVELAPPAAILTAPAVMGALPMAGSIPSYNPPSEVPAMPWATFRGIMWEAYQKGRRGEVLT